MTWHEGIPTEFRDQIVTGDARELAKRLPDCSVDLVFTDPVYDRIEDYEWLGREASRVLKPNSVCLAFCGLLWLPETIAALEAGGLNYRWLLSVYLSNRMNLAGSNWLYRLWQPVLWMQKGEGYPRHRIQDLRVEAVSGTANHHWSKHSSFWSVGHWLDAFCPPAGVVWDPFTGGGTIPAVCRSYGRQWVAFEQDPETATLARERVRNTPLPLLLPDAPDPQEVLTFA